MNKVRHFLSTTLMGFHFFGETSAKAAFRGAANHRNRVEKTRLTMQKAKANL
jgi:hypothetical protein